MVPRQEGKREEKPEGAGHRRRKAAVMPHQEKREKLQMQQKQGAVWHPALFLFTVQMLLTVLQKWYLHSAFSYHRSPLIRHHRSSDRYREAGRPRFSEPFRSLS